MPYNPTLPPSTYHYPRREERYGHLHQDELPDSQFRGGRRPNTSGTAPSSSIHSFQNNYSTNSPYAHSQSSTSVHSYAWKADERDDRSRFTSSTTSIDRGYSTTPRGQAPSHSSQASSSFSRRAKPMAGMLDAERTRNRKERTFVGSECAVCEENLELTLRGERILQFSCGHVAHEACFYEFIKEFDSQYCPTCDAPLGLDASRGGNVLDIEKLSSIVRSVSVSQETQRSSQATPTPWDASTIRDQPRNREDSRYGGVDDHESTRNGRETMARERVERYNGNSIRQYHHNRNDSGTTGNNSNGDFDNRQPSIARRHDYDVQSMETDLGASGSAIRKNPIPPPVVTVRSEYPTLNRSRQQQSLACLVTIEVPEGKWRPDPDDIRGTPSQPVAPRGDDYSIASPRSLAPSRPFEPVDPPELLEDITEDLRTRVDNWHGLDFQRFGKLRLFNTVRVGKDRQSWQELECYLFAEMLICVKEKKGAQPQYVDGNPRRKMTRCTLKGSILIKKHLKEVQAAPDLPILTLSLSVQELPQFHLYFSNRNQLDQWRRALIDLNNLEQPIRNQDYDDNTDDEDYRTLRTNKRVSSVTSWGANRSATTAATEYSVRAMQDPRQLFSTHVPIDMVVVIPVSSSMQGLKISLLRDALRFLVAHLGDGDRMGLVTFGSGGGGVPLVGMTAKSWNGWEKALESIRPVGQKNLRSDVVEGANVAMDLLMQRRSNNPISTILLISDSSTTDPEGVDFVVSRAEAAKVTIHSFGLGLTHKPDTMIELSTRTKASYTYVKDWMMLRECVAGCLGSLQTISHQNVKLKLKLPEGSPAKFVKIQGALQITKRAAGKDAEAALGDLRFGDKRDVLVQLAIEPDSSSQEQMPQDPWESVISGLEALGGSLDNEDQRTMSVEEVPLLQADLVYGDILRDGAVMHPPRPSLLAITMLPPSQKKNGEPVTPPIPPHPSIVQRRMELLTSDMLTRSLTLVSRGQHERAHALLSQTRTILRGLGKGGLPPLPQKAPSNPNSVDGTSSPANSTKDGIPERHPSPQSDINAMKLAAGIDSTTMSALDSEVEASLEWINHPAVFSRDSRKAVLQAIGVISSQRGYTFRTPAETLWADRIAGIKRLTERSKEWRESSDEALTEE